IYFLDLLSHKAELRDAVGVKIVLVPKGHGLKRQNRFARLVHRLDRVLETLRGDDRPEVTAGIYDNPDPARHRYPADTSDICIGLGSCRPNADRVGFGSDALVSNVDVVTTSGEL